LRDINLLPRKSYVEKSFIPLLLLSVSISLLTSVLLIFTVHRTDVTMIQKADQISLINERVRELNQLGQIDQTTNDYNAFNDELRKVKENRRYWMPVFDLLSSNVPPTARIVMMAAKEDRNMSLNMEFADLQQVADFVANLQKSSVFDDVWVQNIEKVTRRPAGDNKDNKAAVSNGLTDPNKLPNLNPINPVSGTTEPVEKEVTKEEYIQSLEKQLKQPTTKSDELLGEPQPAEHITTPEVIFYQASFDLKLKNLTG
jgi:Tfp pilus assembly protein PilN